MKAFRKRNDIQSPPQLLQAPGFCSLFFCLADLITNLSVFSIIMASPNEKTSNGDVKAEHVPERRASKSSKAVSIDFEAQKQLRTVEAGLSPAEVDAIINVDPKEEARILRKIDFRLVPLLALLYL